MASRSRRARQRLSVPVPDPVARPGSERDADREQARREHREAIAEERNQRLVTIAEERRGRYTPATTSTSPAARGTRRGRTILKNRDAGSVYEHLWIGSLGAVAGVGGVVTEAYFQDKGGSWFVAPIMGGAVSALAINGLSSRPFHSGAVAFLGAVAGLLGSFGSKSFVGNVYENQTTTDDRPTAPILVGAGLLGAIAGGAAGMLGTNSLVGRPIGM